MLLLVVNVAVISFAGGLSWCCWSCPHHRSYWYLQKRKRKGEEESGQEGKRVEKEVEVVQAGREKGGGATAAGSR